MNKKLTPLILVFIVGSIVCNDIYAQTFQWATEFNTGNIATNLGTEEMALDQWGNTYMVGRFTDTLYIPTATTTSRLVSNGSEDVFMVKCNPMGQIVWAHAIGGAHYDEAYDVKLTSRGDIILAARFRGAVDFDLGPAVYIDTATGPVGTGYIIKYDSSGALQWTLNYSDSTGHIHFDKIFIDQYDQIYGVGWLSGVVNFNPIGTAHFVQSINASNSMFMLKAGPNGGLKWVKQFDGYGRAADLIVDKQGSIFHTGGFNWWCDFDPGLGSAQLNNFSTVGQGRDIYVSKLDSNGNFVWVGHMGGKYADGATSIALDTFGNVYTTGSFSHIADFDPGPAQFQISTTSNQISHTFISKVDSNGLFVWAKRIYGNNGADIEISKDQHIFLLGEFKSGVDIDPSSNKFEFKVPTNRSSLYIAKYDLNGNLDVGYHFDPTLHAYARSMKIDSVNGIYMFGDFIDTLDVDPGPPIYNLLGGGARNMYVCKLKNCFGAATSVDTCTSSNNITIDGITYHYGGNYSRLYYNTSQCDSVVSYEIRIGPMNANISYTATLLNALGQGTQYQWLKCNPYSIIPGATNQMYNATTTGDYAVIVSHANCVDTSQCVRVIAVGVDDLANDGITVSPNPSSDLFNVKSTNEFVRAHLSVYDILGVRVYEQKNINGNTVDFSLAGKAPGIYILRLESAKGVYKLKIQKR